MATAKPSGRLPTLGVRHLRRTRLDLAFAVLIVGYGALYLGWQVFRWGGPDLELAIADAAFIPLGVLGVAFALLAARRSGTTAGRRAWILISIAFGAYCAGDIAWFWLEVVLGTEPYPSIADALYIAFYPLLLIGLLALPRERGANPVRTLLDLAIVVVGSSTVVWWLVLEPVAAATASSGSDAFVALAYPVGDLLLLFALASTLMSRLVGTSRTALALLGIGLALNVIADLTYARLSLEETYTSGGWIDACYLVGWVLTGLAGLRQAHHTLEARRTGAATPSIHPVSFPPYLAVIAVYSLLVFATETGSSSLRVVVAGAITVTGLVVVRQVLTARENARLLAEHASSRSAARFQAIIQNANDVIAVLDPDGTITYVTPSVSRLVGRPVEGLTGQGLASLVEPEDAPLVLELLRTETSRPGAGHTIPCRVRAADATMRHVEMHVTNLLHDPVVEGLVMTIRDVTERRLFEEQLSDQALHDPLTGLANRALLADRIGHALRRGRRRGALPALLYLDLDDFKAVNDSLGHPAGDRVLVEVSRRLAEVIRSDDTAARVGGDEFAVLVDEARSVEEAMAVADRIIAALREPIVIDGTPVTIAASIGVVRPETREVGPGDLLRNAGIAMYEAKREARGRYKLFELAMFEATVERVSLEADLRAALGDGQFELVYQPLYTLADRKMAGVEALLRWNHPTRGRVMPLQFIPLAERTGEIVPIGRWVIEQACLAVTAWNATFGTAFRANVNVSARQIEPRLVDDVAEILRRTGFAAELLVLEITESVFASGRPGVLEVLNALRSLGVSISIDDFGTGFSSLSMLRDLPVDELKIDRSFIQALTEAEGAVMVEAIIKLSHDFDLATVAEGIEVEDQVASLRGLGCDLGQGYLLGRPVPPSMIEDLIRTESGTMSKPLARGA
jgi:diguanylate cyclase (GGDEF)-like protein/PAS domain S-box-containing protein